MIELIAFVFVGAAILGIIITVMEEGEFPGWGRMAACVLAAIVPTVIVISLIPPLFFVVGLAVGAVCAGFAISATCGMSVKRAIIAASIYLAIQIGIGLVFYLIS